MNGLKNFQRFLILFLISISTFYGGYYLGKRGYLFEVRKNPPSINIINRSPANQDVDFERFWQVWELVSTQYLERPVDTQLMLSGAITGMVNSLGDPYTSFLPPQVNEVITNALNGTYQGIGAELGMRDIQLIVVAPLDGSPAKDAGVRAGDAILEIEGESTLGISVNEAVAKIRGDAGTISTLTLQRDGEDPFTVTIKRGVINIASVIWEDKGDGTAYIRVSRFGADTNKDWDKMVSQLALSMSEFDAVVLDLRGNPGGYMSSAVYLAGEFVKGNKVILYQENALGEQEPHEINRVGAFETIPVVYILLDGGSASASEILAAALKYHVNATIIGTKSFGKGTIQDARDFSDGSGLHLTVAKWLTPDKVWVHKNGIEPDILVERTDEDINNQIDAQLDKALELAKEI
jgi:carboxyl-terminal processing protease